MKKLIKIYFILIKLLLIPVTISTQGFTENSHMCKVAGARSISLKTDFSEKNASDTLINILPLEGRAKPQKAGKELTDMILLPDVEPITNQENNNFHPDDNSRVKGNVRKMVEGKTVLAEGENFTIQLGAFRSEENALLSQKKLQRTVKQSVVIITEGGLYKVRITGFRSQAGARLMLPLLEKLGYLGPFIVDLK